MIKLLTGHSHCGGSTIAHINLVNALNERGIDTKLFGPHDWHLSRCKSDKLQNLTLEDGDNLIVHFLGIFVKPANVNKFIYSCHETNISPLASVDMRQYDLIHYVSESQRLWHNVGYPFRVIPNIIEGLKPTPKTCTKTAGVIGSIDQHKRTKESIQRALFDGNEMVLVYGNISDLVYYSRDIYPFANTGKVKFLGHCDDKQKMYDSVNVVYHSSMRETFNYVKLECELTGTGYNGLLTAESGAECWSKDRIVDNWVEILV